MQPIIKIIITFYKSEDAIIYYLYDTTTDETKPINITMNQDFIYFTNCKKDVLFTLERKDIYLLSIKPNKD